MEETIGTKKEEMENMKGAATVVKWGNGQGIRLSRPALAELKVSIGDTLDYIIKDHQLILMPAKKRRKTVKERFAEYKGPIELTEDWTIEPTGKEVW